MRTLVISPFFPPLPDPQAITTGKFVRALQESGNSPQVIFCSNLRANPRPDGSKMWASLEPVRYDVPVLPSAPLIERASNALRYQMWTWSSWTRAVVAKARELHSQTPFDLVISRSLPHHGNIAGYWVACALRVPWVPMFSDPWSLSPSFINNHNERFISWKPSVGRKIWWRRIVARAQAVAFPSERLRRACLQGALKQIQALVVPHIGAAVECLERTDKFVIVHSGIYGLNDATGRSALPLLDGMAEFFRQRPIARSRTRLVFVGPQDPQTLQKAADCGISETIVCTGLVDYEKSLRFIADASLCVLIEGDMTEGIFLPSKLCDYISARKPVLALSPEIGTVADLAQDGGIRRVRPNDTAGVARALVEHFDAFMQGTLDLYAPPDSLVLRFEGKSVIRDFLDSFAWIPNRRVENIAEPVATMRRAHRNLGQMISK